MKSYAQESGELRLKYVKYLLRINARKLKPVEIVKRIAGGNKGFVNCNSQNMRRIVKNNYVCFVPTHVIYSRIQKLAAHPDIEFNNIEADFITIQLEFFEILFLLEQKGYTVTEIMRMVAPTVKDVVWRVNYRPIIHQSLRQAYNLSDKYSVKQWNDFKGLRGDAVKPSFLLMKRLRKVHQDF